MAIVVGGAGTGVGAEVEGYADALRVARSPRAAGFCTAGITGTMAAALTSNSTVFGMRLDPGATVRAFVERMRLQFTAIAAFTTPVTAGRRLELYRGSGAALSSGTAITVAVPKHSVGSSEFTQANGGDVRISATGALSTTGISWEANPIKTWGLSHAGAAGANAEVEWVWDLDAPLILEPGQLLALRNPAAMDAGGTWQLAVGVEWHEAAAL